MQSTLSANLLFCETDPLPEESGNLCLTPAKTTPLQRALRFLIRLWQKRWPLGRGLR